MIIERLFGVVDPTLAIVIEVLIAVHSIVFVALCVYCCRDQLRDKRLAFKLQYAEAKKKLKIEQ